MVFRHLALLSLAIASTTSKPLVDTATTPAQGWWAKTKSLIPSTKLATTSFPDGLKYVEPKLATTSSTLKSAATSSTLKSAATSSTLKSAATSSTLKSAAIIEVLDKLNKDPKLFELLDEVKKDPITSSITSTKSQGLWAKTKILIRNAPDVVEVAVAVAAIVAGGLALLETHKTNLRHRDELNHLEEMAKQSGAGSNSGFEVEQ